VRTLTRPDRAVKCGTPIRVATGPGGVILGAKPVPGGEAMTIEIRYCVQ
jgi:hypothetical protein